MPLRLNLNCSRTNISGPAYTVYVLHEDFSLCRKSENLDLVPLFIPTKESKGGGLILPQILRFCLHQEFQLPSTDHEEE